jgi:hypothetical protein
VSGRGPIVEPPPDPIGGGPPPAPIEMPGQSPIIGAKPPAKAGPPSTAPANVTSVKSPGDGTPQPGGKLWMRKWRLTIGPSSGESNKSIDLSLLDFEFTVDQQINVQPWVAQIKVWNPSPDIVSLLINKQLTVVMLEAGYQSPSAQYGRVFAGQITYFKHGRANATDSFMELHAATNDTAINAAVVNTWLPVNWQTEDAINALQAAMLPYGVTLGQIPADLDKTKQPRGRLMFGMARDYLRDIERTEHAHFFTDSKGHLHLLRDNEALNMGSQLVPILNQRTGLIDVPTRTMDGAVEATCFLSPAITPGMQVHINNTDVAGFSQVDTDQQISDSFKFSSANNPMVFKADGYYLVGAVKHQGQNRGNPWYSHLTTNRIIQEPDLKKST